MSSKKWNLQDIRPITSNQRTDAERPSLHDRPVNLERPRPINRPRPIERPPTIHEERADDFDELPSIPIENGQKKSNRNLFIGAALVVLVILGGIVVGSITAGATITLYPKARTINVNAEFTAYKERQAGELTYEILTIEATGERQVTASGQEQVVEQTKGTIEIYKTTTGSERLIKNTRFATADGKVFRIQESVVVPGAVAVADGNLVPGMIRAEVFADEPGESYNIPANTRLTVPAFKENNLTELYNAMYATNPEAFSGGFSGPRFVIDENELATAKQSLQLELRDSLRTKIMNERPANFTFFEDAIAITYNSLPAAQYANELVTIREQAVLQVPLFKNEEFASFIAASTILGFNVNDGVRISNLEALRFSYTNATTSQANIANLDNVTFKIIGQPQIVWTYNNPDFTTNLINKEKTAFELAVQQNNGLRTGTLVLRPFWKTTFPGEVEKITINEVVEEVSN